MEKGEITMEWNISSEIFDTYRQHINEFGVDDATLNEMKLIYSEWNKCTVGFGLRITFINNTCKLGLCWKICTQKDMLICFFEDYEDKKVVIRSYSINLAEIAKIEYLGTTNTKRTSNLSKQLNSFLLNCAN